MKKNLTKFTLMAMLTVGAVLSFAPKSDATEPDKKTHIEPTACCQGGVVVALSNNCSRGGETCDNNTCPTGTTEIEENKNCPRD